MADNNYSSEEQFAEALSDSDQQLEVLALGLAQFQGNLDNLVQIIGRTEGATHNAYQNLMQLTQTMAQLGKVKPADSMDMKSLYDGLEKINADQVSQLRENMQGLFSSLSKQVDELGSKSDVAKTMSTGIEHVFKQVADTLDSIISKQLTNLDSQLSSRASKWTEKLFKEGGFAPILEAANKAKPTARDYMSAYSKMAEGSLSTGPAKTAIRALLTQASAKDFTYPAASSGKYHQSWSDVGLHSLDMASILKNLGFEKQNIQAALADSFGDAFKGMNLAQIVSEYAKRSGLSISEKEASKALNSEAVKDTAAVAAFIHDIQKSMGGASKTGFVGYNKEHAKDLVGRFDQILPALDQKAQKVAEQAIQAAIYHHNTPGSSSAEGFGKLGETPIAQASTEQQIVAVLLQIADAVSAKNANPVGVNGQREPNTSGFLNSPVDARSSPVQPIQKEYDRLALGARLETDFKGTVADLISQAIGGMNGKDLEAKQTLQDLGLQQLVDVINSAGDQAKQIFQYVSSANGRSAVGDKAMQQALSYLMGDNQGYVNRSGTGRIPADEMGKLLADSDPLLVLMQTLKPNAFHEISERFSSRGAASDQSLDPSMPKGAATGSSKPALQQAALANYMGEALQSIAPSSNIAKVIAEAEASYLGKAIVEAQPKVQAAVKDSPEYVRGSTAFRPEGQHETPQQEFTRRTEEEVLRQHVPGQNTIAAIEATDAYLQKVAEIAKQLANSGSANDLQAFSGALKKGVEARYRYDMVQAGAPQAEVAKMMAEVQKIQQSIQESVAKAAVMSARAQKTNTENQFLVETADTRKQKLVEETNKAAAQAIQEQVKAEQALATEADKVQQIKADTLTKLSKLTEEQQKQVAQDAASALEANRVESKDFTPKAEDLEPYKAKLKEVQAAMAAVAAETQKTISDDRARAELYAEQTQLVKEQAEAKKKAGGETAAEELTLKALREQYKLETESDSASQKAAQAKLQSRQQELDLMKQQMTLESDLASQAAQAAQAQAQAQSAEYKAVQQRVAAEVAAATQEDQIQQAHIQTKLQEAKLEEQIRKNIEARNNLYGVGVQKNQELLALLQKQAQLPALYRALASPSAEAGGFSYTGAFGQQGQGINLGAAKYTARNVTWGVLGGLTGIASATQLLRQATSNMKDYETAVVNLKRVWQDVPNDQITKALKDLNEMTIQYGQTVQNVADIQEAWAKVGVNTAEELEKLSKVSILALNTADLGSSDDAVTYLNSARVQMALTVDDVDDLLDSWNKLADVTTGDTADFAQAYQKAAGYAHNVGLEYQELDAIIATMIENTGRSGQEIGTALRQIFANTFTSANLKKLQGLGIDVYADESIGQLKEFDVLLADISKKYQELKAAAGGGMSQDVITLLGVLGQTRQRNYAIALLENYEKIGLNGGTGDTYTSVSAQSAGYSEKKFEMTMDTLNYKATQLQAAFTQAANAFGQAGLLDTMKGILSFLTNILTGFANLNPYVRNFVAQFLTWEVVLGLVNKTAKSVFGVTLNQGILNAISNMGKLNRETKKVFDDMTQYSKLSKDQKNQVKASAVRSTINYNGQILDANVVEDSLTKNKAFMESLAKQAKALGQDVGEYQQHVIDSTLANMGSIEHLDRLTAEQNRKTAEAMAATKQGAQATAEAMNQAGDAAERSATDLDRAASASEREAQASGHSAASNGTETVAQEGAAGAARDEATAQRGAATADELESQRSYEAAAASVAQAAAAQAAGKAAALASIKMAALSFGLSVLIGAAVSAISSLAKAKTSLTEVQQTTIETNNTLRTQVGELKGVLSQYDALQSRLASAAEGTEEYNQLKQEEVQLQSEMADLVPYLSDYYDTESGLLIRNTDLLREYLEYKEQLLHQSNSETADTVEDQLRTGEATLAKLEQDLKEAQALGYLRNYMNRDGVPNSIIIGDARTASSIAAGSLDEPSSFQVPFADAARYISSQYGIDLGALVQKYQNMWTGSLSANRLDDLLEDRDINSLADKVAQQKAQNLVYSAQLARLRLEEEGIEFPDIDTQGILAEVESQISFIETEIEGVYDSVEDKVNGADSALADILSSKTSSTKYTKAQAALRTLLADYLQDELVDGLTVGEALKGDTTKGYLTELKDYLEDKLNLEAESTSSTVTELIDSNQRLIDQLEKKRQELDNARAELYWGLEDALHLDEGFNPEDYGWHLELGTSLDSDDWVRDAAGNVVPQEEVWAAYTTWLEGLIADLDPDSTEYQDLLDKIRVFRSELDTNASQNSYLAQRIAELTGYNDELENARQTLEGATVELNNIDYTTVAQDFADKLMKASTQRELREIVEAMTAYFPGEEVLDGISLEDLDLNTPGVKMFLLDMLQRATVGPLADSDYLLRNAVDPNAMAELSGQRDAISELMRLSDTYANDLAGVYEVLNDLIESVNTENNLLDLPEGSPLQDDLAAFVDTYGIPEENVEAMILNFDKESLKLESLAKAAAGYLDTLDSVYENYGDPMEDEAQAAISGLRDLFGWLKIDGLNTIDDLGDAAILSSADQIAQALDDYIQDRSTLGYNYAVSQVELAGKAITDVDILLDETNGMLDAMINSLPDDMQAAARGVIVGALNQLRGQAQRVLNYWNNISNSLKEPSQGKSGLVSNYRGKTATKRSGGGSSKQTDPYEWLDKELEKIDKRAEKLSNDMERLEIIWADDMQNVQYVTDAYAKQEQIIDNLILTLDELNSLKAKVSDPDRLDDLNDKIWETENELIQAYRTLNEIAQINYTRVLEELEKGLERINKKIEIMEASTLSYVSVTANLNTALYAAEQRQAALGDQYAWTTKQIEEQERYIEYIRANVGDDTIKGLFSKGELDAEIKKLQELQDELSRIRLEELNIRQTWVSAVSAYLQKMWKAQYDERIEAVTKLRKEEQKAHDARIKAYQDELDLLKKEWDTQDDERELLDLEAQIAIVKTRIRRLSADTSQYGQKLLKDAYKELGDLESQYADKKRTMQQQETEERIQQQIDEENEYWDNLQGEFDKEQEAYQKQYDTLLENADAFAEGLYQRYQENQEEVLAYLQSEGLIGAYADAGKMAAAAYNAGLLGTLAENPFLNLSDYMGEDGYEATPNSVWGDPGTGALGTGIPGAGVKTSVDNSPDYSALMIPLKEQLDAAISNGDKALFQTLYNQLQSYEKQRNAKISDLKNSDNWNDSWTDFTYNYYGSADTYWGNHYQAPRTTAAPAVTTATTPAPAATPAAAPAAPTTRIYTVRSGDSLWSIAASQLGNGTRWGEIKALNPWVSQGYRANNQYGYLIHPGETLELPAYHTGGVIGREDLPDDIAALFGVGPRETLVKALEGEAMVPAQMLNQAIPSIQDAVAQVFADVASSIRTDDLVRVSIPQITLPENGAPAAQDNSTSIDKVMNIENATFEQPLDVETLEDVAGNYIKTKLARSGVVGTNRKRFGF